jgi:hypothetical protein
MWRAQIMMLMAGREAELVCLGNFAGGDSDDLRQIYYAINEGGDAPVDVEPWLARLRAKTQSLVHRHRAAN